MIKIKNTVIPSDVTWCKRLFMKWGWIKNPYDFHLGGTEGDKSSYFLFDAKDLFGEKK